MSTEKESFIPIVHINKYSSVPLYMQMKESIRKSILEGTLKAGDKVPTEAEAEKQYGVSRTVTRQAYSELVAEGYLIRYIGKGTFVKHVGVRTGFFNEIISFNDEMRRAGYTPKTKVLCLEVSKANERVSEKLGIAEGDSVVHLTRVRYRDDVPVYYCDVYLNALYFPGIEKADLENNSLYDTMTSQYQIRVSRTVKSFSAASCDYEIAKILEVEMDSPVQYVQSLEFDQYDRVVSYDESIYAGRRNVFEIEIIK